MVAIAALATTPIPLLSIGVAAASILMGMHAANALTSASNSDRFEALAAVVLGIVVLITNICAITCFVLRA